MICCRDALTEELVVPLEQPEEHIEHIVVAGRQLVDIVDTVPVHQWMISAGQLAGSGQQGSEGSQ